jgi:arabinogalactan oligomer/maltooligosaccharide transport system permease protein
MNTQWGLYAAGSLIVSIPVVVLFLALSRYLISGLTLGAVKG